MMWEILKQFKKASSLGFALPTVMITSVVMLIVLMAALQTSASISTNIRDSYYTKLAKEAAESGRLFAAECINSGQTWTIKLKTGTNCQGNAITGASSYILDKTATSPVRTSYEVSTPAVSGANVTFTVDAKVELLRGSNASRVWRTVSDTSRVFGNQTSWTKITGGHFNFCGIKAMRAVCWGNNRNGQLGNGTTNANDVGSAIPVFVKGASSSGFDGKNVIGVDAGGFRYNGTICAITDEATENLYCWGYNRDGLVSSTASTNVPLATKRSGLTGLKVLSVSVGWTHICAITRNTSNLDRAYCWGRNVDSTNAATDSNGIEVDSAATREYYDNGGQLGDNTTVSKTSPTPISTTGVLGTTNIKYIAAGATHTCAVNTSNVVACWGDNIITGTTYGVLGNGTAATAQLIYPQIAASTQAALTGKTITGISVGNGNTCVIANNRSVCWGDGNFGQVGDGANIHRSIPTISTGVNFDIKAISTVWDQACAISTANQIYCWGNATYGRIGNNSISGNYPTAQAISSTSGLSNDVASFEAGDNNVCAINSAGNAWCWGMGAYGENTTGGGDVTNKPTPQTVNTLPLSFKQF